MPGISDSLLSEQLGQTKSAQLYWTWQTKNIQGRPRSTEVKQLSEGHIAGQWLRCEEHQDFLILSSVSELMLSFCRNTHKA